MHVQAQKNSHKTCNSSLASLCGASYVGQAMHCKLCGASYAVQVMQCKLYIESYALQVIAIFNVMQVMWCKFMPVSNMMQVFASFKYDVSLHVYVSLRVLKNYKVQVYACLEF